MFLLAQGSPGGTDSKESACNAVDPGSIPGSGRSAAGGNSYPLRVLMPGEFHGQRSLAGYHAWGHQESDAAEQLSLSLFRDCGLYMSKYLLGEL